MPPDLNTTNNAEIDAALREFEAKSQAGASTIPQKPSELSRTSEEVPKIVGLVMKWSGGTLDQSKAEYVLLGFVGAAIIFAGILFFTGSDSRPAATEREMLLTPKPSSVSNQ